MAHLCDSQKKKMEIHVWRFNMAVASQVPTYTRLHIQTVTKVFELYAPAA